MSKYDSMFEGTNFGTTDYTSIIKAGLLKVACGYYNGYTLDNILFDNKFISRKDGKTKLTILGQEELWALLTESGAVDKTI